MAGLEYHGLRANTHRCGISLFVRSFSRTLSRNGVNCDQFLSYRNVGQRKNGTIDFMVWLGGYNKWPGRYLSAYNHADDMAIV